MAPALSSISLFSCWSRDYLSGAQLSTTAIHRSPKPVPFTGANLAPASVLALVVCALRTAGENDNNEIGLLERGIKTMPLLTGLISKSLLIPQIRGRAKRHGFYGMR